MAGKTFNVGVVGYGMSAKIFHIPFIATTPQFKLHSIVQRSPKEGNSAPKDYPDLVHYTDFKDLLADSNVDVVVLTTPPDGHFEQTKDVLQAGKHVLSEKPFVATAAEADKLIDVAKENGKLICVYQNRRWDSDFLLLKHILDQGTLGRIVQFDTHFDRYRPTLAKTWRSELAVSKGGSVVYDLGSHLIDQAYTLFGMPQSVHGRLLNQREARVDFEFPDGVFAELMYPDGLLVNIIASVLSAETTQPRFWVRGTKGNFRKLAIDTQEDQLKAGMKPTEPGFGKIEDKDVRLAVAGDNNEVKEVPVPRLEPETYIKFYNEFGRAVESGKEEDVPVKACQARDVLRIIEAVVESAKSGRNVDLS